MPPFDKFGTPTTCYISNNSNYSLPLYSARCCQRGYQHFAYLAQQPSLISTGLCAAKTEMGLKLNVLWRAPDINPVNRKARSVPMLNPLDPYGRVFFFSWFGFMVAFWAWYSE